MGQLIGHEMKCPRGYEAIHMDGNNLRKWETSQSIEKFPKQLENIPGK
jgi:hypothetical protein